MGELRRPTTARRCSTPWQEWVPNSSELLPLSFSLLFCPSSLVFSFSSLLSFFSCFLLLWFPFAAPMPHEASYPRRGRNLSGRAVAAQCHTNPFGALVCTVGGQATTK